MAANSHWLLSRPSVHDACASMGTWGQTIPWDFIPVVTSQGNWDPVQPDSLL